MMTPRLALSLFLVLGAAGTASAQETPPPVAELRIPESATVAADLPALIECRQGVREFLALMPALQDPLRAVALGWQPLPQTNPFMTEYRLHHPIDIFGHRTDRIAFSGGGVMALLDLPDPRPLAAQLQLEAAIDTPEKVMFGREVRSDDLVDPETSQMLIESVILSVSNVDSHPGKALVGCNYSLDHADAPEPAAPVPAPQGADDAAADR